MADKEMSMEEMLCRRTRNDEQQQIEHALTELNFAMEDIAKKVFSDNTYRELRHLTVNLSDAVHNLGKIIHRAETRMDDKTLTERAIEAEKRGYLSDEETDAFFADARKRIEDAKNDDLKEVTLITLADEPYYVPADIDFNAPGEIMSIEEMERRTGRRVRSVPKPKPRDEAE